MHARRTVTLYEGNRLDRVVERDPDEIAAQFIAAVEAGEFPTPGGGLEFAYRWWLAGRDGLDSTWDEAEWPTIRVALEHQLHRDDVLYKRVVAWAWGES
jgi:hypothetical protein